MSIAVWMIFRTSAAFTRFADATLLSAISVLSPAPIHDVMICS